MDLYAAAPRPDGEPRGGPVAPLGTGVTLSRSVVVDPVLRRRLAWGAAREDLRPLSLPMVVLAATYAVGLGLGGLDTALPWLALIGLAGGALAAGVRYRRRLRDHPVGTVLRSGSHTGAYRLDVDDATDVVAPGWVRRVVRGRHVVRLRCLDGSSVTVPRELVPDTFVDQVRRGLPGDELLRGGSELSRSLVLSHVLDSSDLKARRRQAHSGGRLVDVFPAVVAVALSVSAVGAGETSGLVLLHFTPVVLLAVAWGVDRVQRHRFDEVGTPMRAGVVGGHLVVATPYRICWRPLSRLGGVWDARGVTLLRFGVRPDVLTTTLSGGVIGCPPGLFTTASLHAEWDRVHRLQQATPEVRN